MKYYNSFPAKSQMPAELNKNLKFQQTFPPAYGGIPL
jgi:hypothetical protein